MDPDREPAADWRSAETYAPLLGADRSILAWEWLRRDPGYRAAARAAFANSETEGGESSAERWGLHAFEAPDLPAPQARPVWRVDQHPYVLQSIADLPPSRRDAVDIESLASWVTIVRARSGSEHLLLSDGVRAIRVDVLAGTLAKGPVQLRYLIAGLAAAEAPVLTLRRLLALERTRRFSRTLHPREARARRWVLALRTYDALSAGAPQREIAALLVGRAALEPRWRSEASSLRLQAQRLVRSARLMSAGGYRNLLR